MTEEKEFLEEEKKDIIEYNDEVDNTTIEQDSLEIPNDCDITTISTTDEISNENTTNCLALTIKKEYKIVAVKNVFIKSVRMSWKVVVTAVALNILKFWG